MLSIAIYCDLLLKLLLNCSRTTLKLTGLSFI